MRPPDEMPMDPDVLADLEVVDLTLAGEPVDPEYAELAELALMLQMERQPPREEYARRLDARVDVQFRPRPSGLGGQAPAESTTWGARLRSALRSPQFRGAFVGVAAVVGLVVMLSTNQTASNGGAVSASTTASSVATPSGKVPKVTASSAPSRASTTSSKQLQQLGSSQKTYGSSSTASSSGATNAANGALQSVPSGSPTTPSPTTPADATSGTAIAAAPAPNTTGRKVVQSAQLTLSASNSRIDTVSQEVFDVVSQEHGIVKSSHVTSVSGKPGGQAYFDLSIPSANLETTLQDLSTLRYAHVVSRTNSTQDITKTYRNVHHQLQDAQALRTSLLGQLATAVTQTQIDSLNAQIHDVESRITTYQNQLKRMQHRVSYSDVSVQLYSGSPPPIVKTSHGSGGGFTLSSAAHTAGRVLVVAAGVILIGAAGLVPVALLALLVLWLVEWVRQRRREQALDEA